MPNRDDIEKTKPYKVPKNKKKSNNKKKPGVKKVENKKIQNQKSPQGKKGKKTKKVKKHPKLMLAIKILVIMLILLVVIGAGIIAGVFFGAFGDDFEIKKEDLKIGASNSIIVDQNGNKIADLSGDEKRKVIALEEIPKNLVNAYISMEDERFEENDLGIDIKRTTGAIFKTLTGNKSYGGSTITQQLVKNITKEKETKGIEGIKRKVKEWAKAIQVKRMITNDEILELYLNIIYVADEGNLHGVELGAQYYFNKSAKDLDLAECAYLAGINSAPNYYNPYKLYSETDTEEKRTERIKNKTLTVLAKMKELGRLQSEEEYNTAVAKVEAGLPFSKGTITSKNSYHTEALIEQLISEVMEEKNISRQLAENYIYSSGLTIYSTVDNNVQSQLDSVFTSSKLILPGKVKKDGVLINEHSQAAMAVVDYKTGEVKGVVGGIGEKTEARGMNRATQSVRQCGSSMKPLSAIAPALQEKVITAATAYDDCSVQFPDDPNYKPENYNRFTGLTNIRKFISTSQNIPALKIMKELTPQKSIEYLNKMGLKHIKQEEDAHLSLALGGTKNGATPLEMATAYGTIANNGVYIPPTFYTKVVDSAGNVIMDAKKKQDANKVQVLSEQNAYIVKTIVQEPVKSGGTATYCAIPGIDVAAKTGSTDDYNDRWLCGFTPYYSAACWFGYDFNETISYSGTNPAGQLWDSVMTNIHNKGVLDESVSKTFVRPEGIVEATVCRKTGCLATGSCTDTYKEIFTSDNMPVKCEGHGAQKICTETKLLANEYCPSTETRAYGGTLPKEKLNLWKNLNPSSTSSDQVSGVCTVHKKPETPAVVITEEPRPNNNTSVNVTTGGNTQNSVNNTTAKPVNNTTPVTNTNTNTTKH